VSSPQPACVTFILACLYTQADKTCITSVIIVLLLYEDQDLIISPGIEVIPMCLFIPSCTACSPPKTLGMLLFRPGAPDDILKSESKNSDKNPGLIAILYQADYLSTEKAGQDALVGGIVEA